jgi:hypothetical protein
MEAKKRLNQIHPRTPPTVKHVEAISLDEPHQHHHHHINDVNSDPSNLIQHVGQHFLHYNSPETPEDIRDIRRRYRDERYKKNDVKKDKLVYSSMKPEELSKYISQNGKPALTIPVPNVSMSEHQSLLRRSKSSMGFERSSHDQQKVQQIQLPQQQQQQPITIIYNNFQAPNQAPTPEYLATLANSIIANNPVNDQNEAVKDDNNYDENEATNEAQEWLSTEWDKYNGQEKNKSINESRLSMKSKTPTPTLNEQNDKIVIFFFNVNFFKNIFFIEEDKTCDSNEYYEENTVSFR